MLKLDAAARCAARAPQVLQQLEQAKHVMDFNNYLSYIFSKGDDLPLEVRVLHRLRRLAALS
jgi:hypothetical protein